MTTNITLLVPYLPDNPHLGLEPVGVETIEVSQPLQHISGLRIRSIIDHHQVEGLIRGVLVKRGDGLLGVAGAVVDEKRNVCSHDSIPIGVPSKDMRMNPKSPSLGPPILT